MVFVEDLVGEHNRNRGTDSTSTVRIHSKWGRTGSYTCSDKSLPESNNERATVVERGINK